MERRMQALKALNSMPRGQLVDAFMRCCGSHRWAEAMANARPYSFEEEIFAHAQTTWDALGERDWVEAFSHHPRIGETKKTGEWESQEQKGVRGAADTVLSELAEGNKKYEHKFGYIYLVCATGKSAGEMLEILRARLKNEPADEIRVAAREQAKITRLRLYKLLENIR
jgi:2-oxo-4-hydroxy-4-carboxy-5-ureidoimidazoline decarboxylase